MSWCPPPDLVPRTVDFGRRPGADLGLAAPGVASTLRRHMRTAIASGLLAAAWHAGVADAAAQDSTLLRFRDGSYALNAEVRVNRRGINEPEFLDYVWRFDNPASYEHRHIARVRVLGHEASGESLRFKVEALALLSSPCLNRPLGRPLFQAGQVKSKAVNLTVAPG